MGAILFKSVSKIDNFCERELLDELNFPTKSPYLPELERTQSYKVITTWMLAVYIAFGYIVNMEFHGTDE